MGSINLYKIEDGKRNQFFQEVTQKMTQRGVRDLERDITTETSEVFGISLYISRPQADKIVGWSWVLDAFQEEMIEVEQAPKAIIIVEREDESVYAVTFGHAYFMVDKFCDKNFGFKFARKLTYQEIKTTTLTTPSSHRNKTVNTYINYNELDFDSGESFAKLKAKIALDDGFGLYKPAIEIGNSIKFSTIEESLEQIISLILHVEDTIANVEDKCKIPVFSKVTDATLIQQLDARLMESIREDPAQINISELDIIGASETFNHNDNEFILKYQRKEKNICSLTDDEIKEFCCENGWGYSEVVLDIKVVSLYNGQPVVTNLVKNLIDYTDDGKNCLLSKGIWYKYNEDYLNYLRDSIAEIPVEYHPEFDFSSIVHDDFIEKKFLEEKDDTKYVGKTDTQIKTALKQKYYAERAFNLLREAEDHFENFDRRGRRVGLSNVEEMDLYKDGMMCAVKIGNTSSKLCYAVDQSLTALKLYKKNLLHGIPEVKTVVLWFVLERREHLEDVDGKPDINRLEMLMLKNRLDQWKKEVRVQGFQPLIYINYRVN